MPFVKTDYADSLETKAYRPLHSADINSWFAEPAHRYTAGDDHVFDHFERIIAG